MGFYKRCGMGIKVFISLFFLLGCAHVNIESKKPIKLDVTMRLDVYQHVAKDVTAIEDMIAAPQSVPDKVSFLSLGVSEAYAQDAGDYPGAVKAAIERRKSRREALVSWEAKGVIGENNQGLVVVRDAAAGSDASHLVDDENSDRNIINNFVATKNGVSVAETAGLFAQRIQADAPQGTPIENANGSWAKK